MDYTLLLLLLLDLLVCLLILGLLSLPIGFIGKKRRIGFRYAFLCSILLTPIVGLIVTMMSPTLEDLKWKNDVLAELKKISRSEEMHTND